MPANVPRHLVPSEHAGWAPQELQGLAEKVGPGSASMESGHSGLAGHRPQSHL